jgi:hypothetical protein
MYEWLKKTFSNITNVIFCGVLLVLLLWAVITNIRLYSTQKCLRRTESELGLIRTELSNAQDREREIAEATERTSDLLAQAGTSVKDIREKIGILEEYFYRVDLYFSSNGHDTVNNSEE